MDLTTEHDIKRNDKLILDGNTIYTIAKSINILNNFIDPFNAKYLLGFRFIVSGRIVHVIDDCKQGQIRFVVIERDHKTRYLIEERKGKNKQKSNRSQLSYWKDLYEKQIIQWRGYKMQKHQYLIYSQFQYFQRKQKMLEIAFCPNIQTYQLYLKQYENGKQQIIYFDVITNKILNKQQLISSQFNIQDENNENYLYFQIDISQHLLINLEANQLVNSKVIDYIFKRVAYSYYSQQWFSQSKHHNHLKIFEIANLNENLLISNHEYWPKILEHYAQHSLILFPIHLRSNHFIMIGLAPSFNCDLMTYYQLDSLERQKQFSINNNNYLNILIKCLTVNEQTLKNKTYFKIEEYQKLLKNLKSQSLQFCNRQKLRGPSQYENTHCGLYIVIYAIILLNNHSLLRHKKANFIDNLKDQSKVNLMISKFRKQLALSYRIKQSFFLNIIYDLLT